MSAAAPIPTPTNKPRSRAQDASWTKEVAVKPSANYGLLANDIADRLFIEDRLKGEVEFRLVILIYRRTIAHFEPGSTKPGPAYFKTKISDLAELLNFSTTAIENALARLSESSVVDENGETRPWGLLDVKKNGVVYGLKLCPEVAHLGPLQQAKTLTPRKPAGNDEDSRPVITDKDPVVVMPGNTSRPLPLSTMLERSQCRPPANWDKLPAPQLQIEWESQKKGMWATLINARAVGYFERGQA